MKLPVASLEWLAGSVLQGSPLSRKTILGQSFQTFFWLVTRFLRAQVSPAFPNQRRPLRSEEHTSELQSRLHLVCRLLLEKKKEANMQLLIQYPITPQQ